MSQLTPTDADFDDMHHALGRPEGRWVQPYRNRFCCGVDSPDAARFAVLGSYWTRDCLINGGRDALYSVTPFGQAQVMAWLELRQREAGRRPWLVHGGGLTPRTVVAKSPSAAKYDVYLAIDGSDHWGSFGAFLKAGVRARAA